MATGATRSLVLRVKPEALGTFNFQVKSVADVGGGIWTFDPSSSNTDQQGEFVRFIWIPSL